MGTKTNDKSAAKKAILKITSEEIERLTKNNNINFGKVIYRFNYNISKSNKSVMGGVILTENFICSYDEEAKFKYYDINKIETVKCVMQVGCVSVDFKYDGVLTELCRANFEYQSLFPDFTAQFDLFLLDRSKEISDKSEKNICPKCSQFYEPGTEFCAKCAGKSKTILRLLKLSANFKWKLIISVVIAIIASGVSMIIPWVQRILIDSYIAPDDILSAPIDGEVITSAAERTAGITFLDLLIFILGLIALHALIEVLQVVKNLITAKVGTNLSFNLRSIIFNKIQEMSIAKILKRTAGELINRVQSDTETLNEFLSFTVPMLMQQLIIGMVVTVVIFSYNWVLAVIIFIPLPLFLFINAVAWKFMIRFFIKAWRFRSEANSILYDIFSGIKIVKSFGTEKQEIKRSGKAFKNLVDIDKKSETNFAVLYPITRFFLGLGSYFLTLYIGNQIIGGVMTKGEMMQFMAYMSMIYGPLQWMGGFGHWLNHALVSAAKLFEIIDQKSEIAIQENPTKKDIEGYIDFKGVNFGYKDYEMVLKNINLSVKPGEMIGIVGKSGVGKSTLINLLMRLYDVNSGDITIDGINIKDYDPLNLRSQIGAVLQETFLFSGTIYDNIVYAKKDATRDEIIKAAKFANAHQFIMKLPDGYNTKVGEHGHTLSGGERQRVAIARAVLHDPRILILDEATSALDTETEALVQDALQKLIKNRTTFAIAHRLSTLRNATRLIIFDKGTIAETGTHEELMIKKGIYYSLVMAQRQMSKMAIAKNV